jgi:hypothetical protein
MKMRGWLALAAAGVATAALMGAGQPPSGDHPLRDKMKEKMDGQDDPLVQKYREEFKDELKEHPRIAHSLIALHVTRDHLKAAPHDFGGHRVAAIASIDESIKQLKEAIKFDVKKEETKDADHDKHKKGDGK